MELVTVTVQFNCGHCAYLPMKGSEQKIEKQIATMERQDCPMCERSEYKRDRLERKIEKFEALARGIEY